jgi:pimeloyl-ACP methyl ester carboxylesterase
MLLSGALLILNNTRVNTNYKRMVRNLFMIICLSLCSRQGQANQDLCLALTGTLLTTDKEKIAYCHYKKNHSRVVIIAHGFYSSKDIVLIKKLAKSLLDKYDVFAFDFRGHGKSTGLFTWTSKEGADLETVLGYLKDKYEKIGLISFSLGAAISINTVSKTGCVDCLICVSIPSEFGKIDYKFWQLDWENDIVYNLFDREGRIGKGIRPGPFWLKKKKPAESIEKIEIPVLYIHGDKDWVIRPWHSKALYEKTASKKRLVIVKDGPHAEFLLRKFPDRIIGLIKSWLKDTLIGGGL